MRILQIIRQKKRYLYINKVDLYLNQKKKISKYYIIDISRLYKNIFIKSIKSVIAYKVVYKYKI